MIHCDKTNKMIDSAVTLNNELRIKMYCILES